MKTRFEKIFPLFVLILVAGLIYFYTHKNNLSPEIMPDSDPDIMIVSLSPSITREMILLEKQVNLVGVTSYCPPLDRDVPKVGNLLNPNVEKIISLEPDLVLFSEEDNPTMKFESLMKSKVPVYKFGRNRTFDDISANFIQLSKITGVQGKAEILMKKYSDERKHLAELQAAEIKGAFFLASKPLISVSAESYISNILADAGIRNIIAEFKNPYPVVSVEYLLESKPEIIFSTDPEAESFFSQTYSKAGLKKPLVITMSPDNVCYYTPEDYISTLRFFTETINENF